MSRYQLLIDVTRSVKAFMPLYGKKWRSGQVTPMPHSKTERIRKVELLSSLEVGVELA